MGILANENSIGGGNYLIERSLRFQSASTQYLSRTNSTPTQQNKWTFSAWVKRGALQDGLMFGACNSGSDDSYVRFATNAIQFGSYQGVGTDYGIKTSAVLRDPSAWYHIVAVYDTGNATSADRAIIYINGVRQVVTNNVNGMFPSAYTGFKVNTASQAIRIGARGTFNDDPLDGYMTEINFIDGQALTPSSFGETDALTGVWVAKRYTGTYGTNGFYLKFNDGTSTTTLGQDRSGNANNWTLTNFTRSAGTSDCWMLDVPSGNGSPSATQPSSNYAVLSPIGSSTSAVESEANLKVTTASASPSNFFKATSTIAPSSGKWYFESTIGAIATNNLAVCISGTQTIVDASSQSGLGSGEVSYFGRNAAGTPVEEIYVNGVSQFTGTAANANDVIGVAFDADNRTVQFYRNNTAKGSAYTITSANAYYISAIVRNNTTASIQYLNFGQRSFAYTPPSGFKALCTANLPAPTIAKGNQYMDATLYTGNATARSITNAAGFSPEFVWIKERSSTSSHQLFDVVRGATKNLESNTTSAEGTFAQTLSSFNADGFSLGTDSAVNENTQTYVAWQWDAGSSTVTNTSGTISSQVRASTTSGVSIVTYTGNSSASATVGHGLGIAPKMIIVKERSTNVSGWNTWVVYHESLGNTKYILLNSTAAVVTSANAWNNTNPTSSVFTVAFNAGAGINYNSATYVAYCFAEIAGFSKFGSYTGNGSTDGPFVYCGFRPKYIMYKNANAVQNWIVWDTTRTPNNVVGEYLLPNTSGAEGTVGNLDILSNGFKLRTTDAGNNGNGNTMIFMAFAENPFNYSNAR